MTGEEGNATVLRYELRRKLERCTMNSAIADNRGDERSGRHIERGVVDVSVRRSRRPGATTHFIRRTLFDVNIITTRRRWIECARWSRDVERHAVVLRGDCQGVGPNLIRYVSIRRDPIRPDEYEIDFSVAHQR